MRGLFGEIIEWMGRGIPIIILLGTAFICFVLYENERYTHADAATFETTIIIGVAVAAIVFVIGRALRYFLGGKS
jgi:hypothetical protein